MRSNLLIVLCVIISLQSGYSKVFDNPPPFPEKAKMARYVVHNSDWTSIGTTSTMTNIKGFPFVGLKSVSDGPDEKPTGVPYMMMTDMDISMKDLLVDNRCTLFFSLAESSYCKHMNYDPQDPRCARIMLTGSVRKIHNNTEEYQFAKDALYKRHPDMKIWPIDHYFFIARLDIIQVCVLDFFGGISMVSVEDYMKADIDTYLPISKRFNLIEVKLVE